MGKQTGLHLILTIRPSAALVQIHPLVPFAPFLKSPVYKAPQVIQICFDKVTVVVLPATHQWIQTIRNHIYTTRPGTESMIGILPSTNYNQNFILNFLRFIQPEIKKAAYQMSGQPNIKIPTLTLLHVQTIKTGPCNSPVTLIRGPNKKQNRMVR